MDNITHSLTGLALARAGLGRLSPKGAFLLIVAANAPDVDILAMLGGELKHLEIHRGYTHSLLGLPFLAAFVVIAVSILTRKRLRWGNAWMLACIGIASHLLLDSLNAYGVRLLLPFSSQWFHLDSIGLTDLWIMAALVLATVWPFFSQMVTGEIGGTRAKGKGVALFALVFFAWFIVVRLALHHLAVAQLESQLYEDTPPLSAAALPNPYLPWKWRGIVEGPRSYRLSSVNALSETPGQQLAVFYKPAPTRVYENTKRTEAFRYFLYFARFPVWSTQTVPMLHELGSRVDLVDLRFGSPGVGSLHCIALENGAARVLGSWFTYGTGSELGWGDHPR